MGMIDHKIKEIEGKAEDVLSLFQAGGNEMKPPIDLDKILAQSGLTLKFGTFKDERVSGYYSRPDRTIYVAEDDPYHRQAFTIAHELGHFYMHKEREQEIFYRTESLQLDVQDVQEEKEANRFAAALLMPAKLVELYWEVMFNIKEMAKVFNVSQTAMAFRLKNLGLVK